MALPFDPISSISNAKDQWRLHVRVVRMYSVPDQYCVSSVPFSVELVLQDEAGDRIQASIRKTLIYKFQKLIKEDESYNMYLFGVAPNTTQPKLADSKFRLNFQYHTEVIHKSSSVIPLLKDCFKPLSVLLAPNFSTNTLVDVMAVLTGVGTETEVGSGENKSKMIKLGLSVQGIKLECALFGPYVDEVHAFVSSGNVCNTVIGIQFAKAKLYRGRVGLQNVYHTTKLFFNLQTSLAIQVRKNFLESNVCVSETLTQLTEIAPPAVDENFFEKCVHRTIEEINDLKEEAIFVVMATITHIVETSNWWYMSCKSCRKSVYADSSMYYCDTCVRHVISVTPRYRLKVRVMDQTDSATFIMFDREASEVVGKTCPELIDSLQQSASMSDTPEELYNLVGKMFLFKSEYKIPKNPKFAPSLCVRRVTSDPVLIQKFKDDFISKCSSGINMPSGSLLNSDTVGNPSDEETPKEVNEANLTAELEHSSAVSKPEKLDKSVASVPVCSAKRSSEDAVDLSSDEVVSTPVNKLYEFAVGLGSMSSNFSADLTPCKIQDPMGANDMVADSYSCTLKKKIKVEKE